MPRNPYWTDGYAALTLSNLANDDTTSVSWSPSTTATYEYFGFSSGSLSYYDTLDFSSMTLYDTASYTFIADGSYQMNVAIYDSQGYLLLFTDGDDVGASDAYPTDSIVSFVPDYSGTYYITTGFDNGSFTGTWSLGVAEDFGGDFSNGNSTGGTTTSPGTPNTVTGSSATENLVGSSGSDEMYGYQGDDTINGGDGSDIIYGNQGVDNISGGSGNDTIYAGQNSGELSGDPLKYRDGIDTVNGGSGDDVLYGNFGVDILYGGVGDDRVFGGQDNDIIYGESGNDVIFGNIGNDWMNGGSGADTFIGGAGQDTVADFNVSEGDRLLQASQIISTTDGASGALIQFEDGNSVELTGIAAASVTNSYFI